MKAQIAFPFLQEIDKDQAEKAEQDRLYWKRRNNQAILESHVRDMPPVSGEWDVILMGIRLARHVHPDECERCNLGHYNHCPPHIAMHWIDDYGGQWTFTKVCLKDFLRKCMEWGIKYKLS